jgi:hypothetical protein
MKKHAGDKTVFAIEYKLYLVKPTNYFGDFWFWVNGEKIGAEEADTYLSSCVYFLKEFFVFKDIRRFAGSENKSASEMFYLLHERFFGDDARKSKIDQNFGIFRAIFSLDEIGDANTRDEVIMILIDEPAQKRQRFIWRKHEENILIMNRYQ